MSMKLTLREMMVLETARPGDGKDDIEYIEKIAKNEVDRVIAVLEKSESGQFTKIARRFWRLGQLIKAATAKRAALDEDLREKCEGLFAAEDIVLTRVVATAKFVVTLAKKVPKDPSEMPEVVIDYKGIVAELEKLIPAELSERVEEIKAQYTAVKKQPAKKPAMQVKPKDPASEQVDEGAVADMTAKALAVFKKVADSILKAFTKWAVKFDDRLAALRLEAGIK